MSNEKKIHITLRPEDYKSLSTGKAQGAKYCDEGARVWHTSDTHFGHKTILRFCPQTRGRWDNVKQMAEDIIQEWNNLIAPNDIVIHYGDFHFSTKANARRDIEALNGRIYALLGNHDKRSVLEGCSNIVDVLDNPRFIFRKPRVNPDDPIQTSFEINAFHYPIWDWNGLYRGRLHVFGHTHDRSPMPIPNAIECGFDSIRDADGNFYCRPVETSELLGAIRRRNEELRGNPIAEERWRRFGRKGRPVTLAPWDEDLITT